MQTPARIGNPPAGIFEGLGMGPWDGSSNGANDFNQQVEAPASTSRAPARAARRPYSFRDDDAVPRFDDRHPLIVYDGICVLCSRFVRFVVRRDRTARFRFTAAQSPLGQALYRHYGLDPVVFETNLLIADGRMHARMGAFARVMARLPWPWRALAVARLLPGPVGRWLYDRVASNRYRLFGRLDTCMVPDPDVRSRFIG